MILLDTHAAVWFAAADNALGSKCRALIEGALADAGVAVSSVTFWEIALLIAKKRLDSLDSPRRLRMLLLGTGVIELPLSGDAAISSTELSLHGDPADRFIPATAIAHAATLVTADEQLLRWEHALPRHDARR